MRRLLFFLLLSGFTFQVSSLSYATIRFVDPGHYQTIGAAYTDAVNGDSILISEGFYNENLTFAKRLTALGAGMDITIINGQISLNTGASNSILEGVAVISGVNFSSTINIAPTVDSLLIRRCRVQTTSYLSAAVGRNAPTTSRLFIDDCVLYSIAITSLTLNGDFATVRNCIIANQYLVNSGSAAIGGSAGSLVIQNCTIVGAVDALFGLSGSFPFVFTNNIIYDFSGNWGTYPPNGTLDYNAFTGTPPQGHTANYVTLTQNPFINYSTTTRYVYGTSNLHLDPTNGLPCINAGIPVIHDLDGTRSDLGTYGGQLPLIDSGAPAYPFVTSFTVPIGISQGQNLPIQSQGRIGRGY